ncbi:MAG: tetratricopeptide repeat protein [Candidatus Gastranaerophilales bacterium]|nr:tetratricopeptide repeat protein [Candidatus Gastranaerophilales bacterium]
MNKSSLKLLFCMALGTMIFGLSAFADDEVTQVKPKPKIIYQYNYNTIPLKQPVMSKSMMPAVNEYNKGNYLGAMVELKELVEKEKDNVYAKYYLALCYTQLGYRSEAQQMYNDVAESGYNYALSYTAQRATICIDNPNSQACLPPKKITAPKPEKQEETRIVSRPVENPEPQVETDELTKFIKSGKKIHPAAMDRITLERMTRKVQADMYSQAQANKQEAQDADKKTTPSKKRKAKKAKEEAEE